MVAKAAEAVTTTGLVNRLRKMSSGCVTLEWLSIWNCLASRSYRYDFKSLSLAYLTAETIYIFFSWTASLSKFNKKSTTLKLLEIDSVHKNTSFQKTSNRTEILENEVVYNNKSPVISRERECLGGFQVAEVLAVGARAVAATTTPLRRSGAVVMSQVCGQPPR